VDTIDAKTKRLVKISENSPEAQKDVLRGKGTYQIRRRLERPRLRDQVDRTRR
jgi:hypothetical protein